MICWQVVHYISLNVLAQDVLAQDVYAQTLRHIAKLNLSQYSSKHKETLVILPNHPGLAYNPHVSLNN